MECMIPVLKVMRWNVLGGGVLVGVCVLWLICYNARSFIALGSMPNLRLDRIPFASVHCP